MVQFRTVVEYLLITVFHQRRGRQFRRLLDALTTAEHILVAAFFQGGGWQHEFPFCAVHEFLGSCKQTVESIVCLDGIGIGKVILALQQTHHVTVDLGLHARLDVDVLRTRVNGTGHSAGCSHSTTAKRSVDAIELHHIALLHGDVETTLGVLRDRLLGTAVDRVMDVVFERDTTIEGDGDLTVLTSDEGQRG